MFMDSSSELIHSLLPVFMGTILGASAASIGIIEGIAEAAAAITKVFSGALSDRLGKRKALTVFGYGLAAFSKPIFPLAGSLGWVFAARFVDRIGKGIRGAPRDALVADITPSELRGSAYGLRQSLDSAGAVLGPLLAVVFMIWLANDIRSVLWIAVIPAFIAVALLVFGVQEPGQIGTRTGARVPVSFADMKQLALRYWYIVLLGAVFMLARFSEAFMILLAQKVGLPMGYVPVVFIVMNVAYAATAYPAGVLSDRISARALLAGGLAILVAADVLLAFAESSTALLLGAGCWGIHLGLTQGLFAKLVADNTPAPLRGTAFGIFNLVSGGGLLLASILAGVLWTAYGAPATFLAGAGFAALAAIGLLPYHHRKEQ
ncbi:MAG: MFS transporter [Bacteroidetes bacterium]|nr:MFS transporter [Bacteroidota bacterium]